MWQAPIKETIITQIAIKDLHGSKGTAGTYPFTDIHNIIITVFLGIQ